MTQQSFHKYQGTGNDFILIDNRELQIHDGKSLAQKLCDRKFGIGSDGLILIQHHDSSDFEMVFYNPDGSQSLCGNGSRCAVKFAHKLGLMGMECTFMAHDGKHQATVLPNGHVKLMMNDVHSVSKMEAGIFIDTGSPHLMVFKNDIAQLDVPEQGKLIRYSEAFKKTGVNVNFVSIQDNQTIAVRTYERGVENETLSCGTGVTASALAASSKLNGDEIHIKTKGGNLSVSFEKIDQNNFKNIYLTGPAEEVFSGTIAIK